MVVWNVAMHMLCEMLLCMHSLFVYFVSDAVILCNYLTYVCNKTFISHFAVNMRYELLGRVNNGLGRLIMHKP